MDYYEEAAFELQNYLQRHDIDPGQFNENQLNEMTDHYYKNYYSYEMDADYAAQAAVSVVIKAHGIKLDHFESWIP